MGFALPYLQKKNFFLNFSNTHTLSVQGTALGYGEAHLPLVTTPAPVPDLSVHMSARWAAWLWRLYSFPRRWEFASVQPSETCRICLPSRLLFASRRVRPIVQALCSPLQCLGPDCHSINVCWINTFLLCFYLYFLPHQLWLTVW